MNPDRARKLSTDERKLLLDQLGSEYRILQDKIDKIAGFRFTIRGWSVTLVIASSIGAVTAKIASAWVLCGLIPFILAFLLMERAQLRYRRTFGGRVIDIEKRISRVLNDAGDGQLARTVGRVPRIAHELEEEAAARNSFLRWIEGLGDFVFYGLQVVAILLVVWWLGHRNLASPGNGQSSGASIKQGADQRETGTSEIPEKQTPDSMRQKDGEKKK